MNAPVDLQSLRAPADKPAAKPAVDDYAVDLFTSRGVGLAFRVAERLAESDIIPVAFRRWTTKRGGRDQPDQLVENPSAVGNLVILCDMARLINIPLPAMLMNCHVIEGKLSWSAQFVIAAVEATGRFEPLRYDLESRGTVTATYQEKAGWNKEDRRYNMVTKSVEIEDLTCVAWTVPKGVKIPHNVVDFASAKAAGLPAIRGTKVSMRMAVEEGWYARAGSKWQTEMREQMLQYRAGAFFGRVHASGIMMGLGGQTTEERMDVAELKPDASGVYSTADDLREKAEAMRAYAQSEAAPPAAEAPPPAPAPAATQAEPAADDSPAVEPEGGREAEQPAQQRASNPEPPAQWVEERAAAIDRCRDTDALDLAIDALRPEEGTDAYATLIDMARDKRAQLQAAANSSKPAQPTQPAARRRPAGPTSSML